MSKAVASQTDLSVIRDLYFQDVITKDQCNNKSEQQLQMLLQNKIEEAKISFENSRLLLNGQDVSVPFSECIVVAEKACLSARNIKEVLESRNLLLSAQLSNSLVQVEKELESTRKLQPRGETTLQYRDFKLVEQMGIIPANETYTSDRGIVYYEPKVSHMNVRPFFEEFCQEGSYKSVQTATKHTNRFFSLEFKGNFHCVSLMKTKEQANFLLKQIPGTTSEDKKAVESWHSTGESEKDLLGELFSVGTQLLPSIKWTSHEGESKAKKNPGIKEMIEKQKHVIEKLSHQLPRVIQDEKWGFEGFKILTTEEKIKLGIAPRDAVMSDSILLFHKKVEPKS